MLKLGQVLYRHMLDEDNFLFAKQAGATHLVVHLTDYFAGGGFANPSDNQPTGTLTGWGRAGDPNALWSASLLRDLKKRINDAGLELEALENIDPAFWHDVLLDGPKRDAHVENVKTLIRNMGEVGIPILGYFFSLAGVCCRTTGPFARGGAESVGMDAADQTPIPRGMVWNMVYDDRAPAGHQPSVTSDELWGRLKRFLEDVIPVAEGNGVALAAHPDDPPVPELRSTPRLIHEPDHYQRLFDLVPSPNNCAEFCIGTLAEMPATHDIYSVVDRYIAQGDIAYIHLRNVAGKAPRYHETFIDDGDTDMLRVIRILHRNGFDGVLIPDHTPQMNCDAPWHAGMAFALGYMKALITAVESETIEAHGETCNGARQS